MKVKNMADAWEAANQIFPTDYEKDDKATKNAGYPIYRSTAEGHYYDYICDLGDRLELNLSDGRTINIWIEPDKFKGLSKEMIKKIGETIITKMRIANQALRKDQEYPEYNVRTNPFYSEFNGMLRLVENMGIEFDVHWDRCSVLMTGITISGEKFEV